MHKRSTSEFIFLVQTFWKVPAAPEYMRHLELEEAQPTSASPPNNNPCFLACPTLVILVQLFSGMGCPSQGGRGRSWYFLALHPESFVHKPWHLMNKPVWSSRYTATARWAAGELYVSTGDGNNLSQADPDTDLGNHTLNDDIQKPLSFNLLGVLFPRWSFPASELRPDSPRECTACTILTDKPGSAEEPFRWG